MTDITWPKISRLLGYQTYYPENITASPGIIQINNELHNLNNFRTELI